jgi:DNA-binding NarL/FixJ family response regulator
VSERATIPVVVAEDEWHYREALVSVLARASDIEVVGEAGDAEKALQLVQRTRPGVVLLDLNMPEMGGLELTRRIRELRPETAVIVFTVSRDETDVLGALAAGASGYLVKQETRDASRLYEAIRVVAAGGTLLSGSDAQRLVQSLARRGPVDPAARYRLTRREREVLLHVADGSSNRQIADALVITEQAVKNHVGNVLRKLDAPNRTAAAAIARREGLV